MEELLVRIDALRKSNVYSGTVYESNVQDCDVVHLESIGYRVIRRNCSVYPIYVTWC